MLPPVAIVWPCPLSVERYVAAGRDVEVPRPDCPRCGGTTSWWSGYRRFVRAGGVSRPIFVPRVRCGRCAKTDAVLPAFVFCWSPRCRRDDRRSHRGGRWRRGRGAPRRDHGGCAAHHRAGMAAPLRRAGRPSSRSRSRRSPSSSAARSWARSAMASATRPPRSAMAFEVAATLAGWAALGRWRFASAVSGGSADRHQHEYALSDRRQPSFHASGPHRGDAKRGMTWTTTPKRPSRCTASA